MATPTEIYLHQEILKIKKKLCCITDDIETNGFDGIVDDFSDLPLASEHNGDIYYVINTTDGSIGGIYYSDGATWISSLTLFDTRITNLENNVYKVTYYEIVSGTSGTITPPTGATFNSGEFGDSGNSILSKINGSNKPTFQSPLTVGGVVVTANLNTTTGAWTTSGTYVDASVALIYSINISADDFSNLNNFYIIESEENVTSTLLTGYASTTGTITSSDSILTAIEKLNGNISAIPPSTLLGVSAASTTAPNSIYNLSAGIPINFKSSDGNSILYLDETTENTGYGTTSPAVKIHGSIGTASGLVAHFGNTQTNNATWSGLSFGYGAGGYKKSALVQEQLGDGVARGKIHILNDGAADANDASLTDARLTIDYNGNIGFNTTSPVSKLHIGVAPTSIANYGLISLGSGAFDGSTSGFFTGSSSGTVIAVNAASGFAGNLIDLQVAGAKKFAVSQNGFVRIGANLNTGIAPSSNTGLEFYNSAAPTGGNAAYAFYGRKTTATSGTVTHIDLMGNTLGANNTGFAAGAGSANWKGASLIYEINNSGAQSGTATGIFLNATETALNSMTHNLMDLQVGGVSKLKSDNVGNLLIGASTVGTSGTNTFVTKIGTSPTTSPTDTIQIFAKDSSAGSANATLAMRLEQAVEVGVGIVSTDKVRCWINGIEYFIALTAV